MDDGRICIVLDAGHGGVDGGVTGICTGVKESDLNLSITRLLSDELTDMGFETVLTRKTEAGLYGAATKGFKKRDMQKRREIILERNPALVISIHQNYFSSQKTRGGQVFYRAKNEGGLALATRIQTRLNELYAEEKVRERKATTGAYFMLECTSAPSVIVECGFLSSPEDERLLVSGAFKRRLVREISAGVAAYFEERSGA